MIANEPPAIERRITVRLLAYWEKLRRNRPMPAEEDIDPEDISDLWENCFLIHVKDLAKADYNYTFLGQNIIDAYNHGLSADASGGLVSPNASKLTLGYSRVVESCKPLLDEGEFHNLRNEMVKYRQCLLPLGQEGKVVAIFGGMRFKIFPAE